MPLDDYDIEVVPLHGPVDPESWYWKLYHNGTRINGGISDYQAEAYSSARRYRSLHDKILWQSENVWDVETGSWIPRSALNL